jgi:opacity protein-like surface antigen
VKKIVFIILLASTLIANAQEKKVYESFKNTRVINLQSVESLQQGIFELKISHRFGAISTGAVNLWGIDVATMRIGLEQGITDHIMVGIGRSTFQKTFDAFAKWRVIQQKKDGMPFSLSGLTTINVNGLPFSEKRTNYFSSRVSYINQILIASKFNDQISLQLSPTIIHKNLVKTVDDLNNTYALGVSGSYNLKKHISLNLEYVLRIKQNVNTPTYTDNYNSLSVGLGIETKGHFFEFHLTNSMPMNETSFITETSDSWLKGNIHPGFNLVRDFRVYKKRK